jgi:C4-dicarboxylate transporter DctM subunit
MYLQVYVNRMPLAGMYNALIETIARSTLLAIPFFILAGNLMGASSLGDRLVTLSVALLKRVRGGFAIACLVANTIFAAISGSSPATIATFGPIIFKPMEKLHGTKIALGVLTSSGSLSAIVPPSITMIVFCVVTNTSVPRLFLGGFLPGILIALIVGTYLFFRCKPNTDEEIASVATEMALGRAFFRGIPVLVMPIMVLGSIYGGIFTPTEAAAFASVYACAIALTLKDMRVRDLPRVVMQSTKTAAQILVLIAVCSAFAQASIVAQMPRAIASMIGDVSAIQFLLILNVLLLLVGLFFEPVSAVLIVAPLLFPMATGLGIDPIHLGVIFTVNLAIGLFTPPFGLNIFVVQSVLGKGMGEIIWATIPFMILYTIACLIITYVPWISLVLPNAVFGGGWV